MKNVRVSGKAQEFLRQYEAEESRRIYSGNQFFVNEFFTNERTEKDETGNEKSKAQRQSCI